jgi:diacylglycerol kinase family enzyme
MRTACGGSGSSGVSRNVSDTAAAYTVACVRVLVVSNPRATATTARQRDVLVHALAADAKLDVEETANRGHAAALACRAMRDGVDAVVALGGDGTVNEVVNGLLTDGVHGQVPVLGVVPGGSTNVFARALGLPNDPVEATSVLLDAMATDRHRRISLGRADERWFVFAAGLGLDASVVNGVEAHRRRGRKSTHALYVRTTVRRFFAEDRRNPAISVEFPDGEVLSELYMAVVTNCTPWTFLGDHPISPTPRASFDAGLDLYVRNRMGLPSVALGASRIIRGRTKEKEFGAVTRHDLTEFVVRADRPLSFQVDGDALSEREVVRFRGVRRALRVYV